MRGMLGGNVPQREVFAHSFADWHCKSISLQIFRAQGHTMGSDDAGFGGLIGDD